MKIIEVLAVAIRIMGLCLLLHLLEHMPSWLLTLGIIAPDNPPPASSLYFQYGIFITLVLVAFLMLKLPAMLARLLVGNIPSDSPLLEENGQAIQIAGIAIIGVYTLTWAVPDLFHNVFILWVLGEQYRGSGYLGEIKVNIAVTLIEIGIGLYCALGARGISKVINKLRS